MGLSVIIPQTRTDLNETPNISEGHGAHSHKNGGNRPWFCLRVPNMLFSVTNATWPFSHLYCTDFDHFKTRDVNRCVHAYTKFQNLCAGVFQAPKQPKRVILRGCLL